MERSAQSPLRRGRHGLSRAAVEANQRERLLTAMVSVTAAEGYGATTVAKVTAAAGVSRRTFYELFDNKEACFLTAYEDGVAAALDEVAAGYARPGPIAERVRRGLAGLLEFCAAHPELARMCMVEVMAAGPRAMTLRTGTLERFAAYLDVAQREAAGSASAASSLAIVGGIFEVIVDQLVRGRAGDLPALTDDLLATRLAPITDGGTR